MQPNLVIPFYKGCYKIIAHQPRDKSFLQTLISSLIFPPFWNIPSEFLNAPRPRKSPRCVCITAADMWLLTEAETSHDGLEATGAASLVHI